MDTFVNNPKNQKIINLQSKPSSNSLFHIEKYFYVYYCEVICDCL